MSAIIFRDSAVAPDSPKVNTFAVYFRNGVLRTKDSLGVEKILGSGEGGGGGIDYSFTGLGSAVVTTEGSTVTISVPEIPIEKVFQGTGIASVSEDVGLVTIHVPAPPVLDFAGTGAATVTKAGNTVTVNVPVGLTSLTGINGISVVQNGSEFTLSGAGIISQIPTPLTFVGQGGATVTQTGNTVTISTPEDAGETLAYTFAGTGAATATETGHAVTVHVDPVNITGTGIASVTRTEGNTFVVNAEIPAQYTTRYQFRVNFKADGSQVAESVTDLPSGWTATIDSGFITIAHGLNALPRSIIYWGYNADTQTLVQRMPSVTNPVSLPCSMPEEAMNNILFAMSTANTGADDGGYALVSLFF